MPNHTQGPWEVRDGIDECFIDAPGVVCLAKVNKCVNNPDRAHELEGNARLIALAPQLLDAIEVIHHLARYDGHFNVDIVRICQTAMRKLRNHKGVDYCEQCEIEKAERVQEVDDQRLYEQ